MLIGEASDEPGGRVGGHATFNPADVTREAEVTRLVQRTVERRGRLDCAHNNAGIEGFSGSLLDYPDDVFDRVLAANFKRVWLCTAAASLITGVALPVVDGGFML